MQRLKPEPECRGCFDAARATITRQDAARLLRRFRRAKSGCTVRRLRQYRLIGYFEWWTIWTKPEAAQ